LTEFESWAKAMAQRNESCLNAALPAAEQHPSTLHEAMRYAVLDGGKRVRPLLVYAAGELSQANSALLDGAACAVEMIHAYSLVHDDLPCMDNDILRRGKPTVHVAYGEAQAMLVGDALQAQAFLVLAQALKSSLQGADSAAMFEALAFAAGSQGMAGGQAIDLAAVGQALSRDQLQTMHQLKTGAMLRVSVMLGYLAGASNQGSGRLGEPAALAPVQKALETYCAKLGLAFQVVDDILDVESDSATLGKTAGKDQDHGKPTYVSLLGLAQAKALAEMLHQEALVCLEGFGAKAQRLRQLADFIVLRKS
jgi:farnesyl diphosphate synthase